MTATRRLALASGVFYLLTFVFSIPAYFLYEPVLTDHAYIIGSGGADTRVILGALFELLTALSGIGTAVAAYPVIRRQSEPFSLGFVTTRKSPAPARWRTMAPDTPRGRVSSGRSRERW